MDLFQRCGKKIERAAEHLNALQMAAQWFAEEHGNAGVRVTVQPNSQGTKCLVKVAETPAFPEVEWGIVIGDAVHCLRSALDQMVSGLCTEPSGRTAFPICRTEKDWIIDAPGHLWSIPPRFVALIDEAQPYHRGDKAHMHPLAVLNELWNLDKHRAIPSSALVPNRVAIAVDESKTIGLASWSAFRTYPGRLLKEGTVIADCRYTVDSGATKAEMHVQAHLSVDVGFGKIERAASVNGKPVGETFKNVLIPAVFDVVVAAKRAQGDPPAA